MEEDRSLGVNDYVTTGTDKYFQCVRDAPSSPALLFFCIELVF